MTHYEMAEKLSEKMGVTMEEANAALERCDWEMLDAALLLERERGEADQRAWSSAETTVEPDPARTAPRTRGRGAVRTVGRVFRNVFNMGNRNFFEIRKGDESILEMPVTVLAVLVIFAFWPTLILLVLGLLFGLRYYFCGNELGRESVNRAMEKAAEVAEKVKEEVRGDH